MLKADGEVLATMAASPARRILGAGMLGSLGVLTLYMAMTAPPSPGWLVFLLVVGAASLWCGLRLWQATAHTIELTTTELRCTDGTLIARVEDLDHIDRGFFAFKPSNGFVLRSKRPAARAWYPGLWWRMGRRIGVGGVTPGQQGKTMSEILAAMMAGLDPQ